MCTVDFHKGLKGPKVRAEVLRLVWEGFNDIEIAGITGLSRKGVYQFRWRRGIWSQENRLKTDITRKDTEVHQEIAKKKLKSYSNEAELWGAVIREAINDVVRCCRKGIFDAEGSKSLSFLEGGGNWKTATMILKSRSPMEISREIISALKRARPDLDAIRTHKGNGRAKPKPNPKGWTPVGEAMRRAIDFRPKYQRIMSDFC